MEKLLEIQSLHEQREKFYNPDIIVKKGVWLEILDFDPDTEQIDINRRWEVVSIEKKEENGLIKYKIICIDKDIKKSDELKKALAEKVLDKHKEKLKASFTKALIEGIDYASVGRLKYMLNKLGETKDDKQKDN